MDEQKTVFVVLQLLGTSSDIVTIKSTLESAQKVTDEVRAAHGAWTCWIEEWPVDGIGIGWEVSGE